MIFIPKISNEDVLKMSIIQYDGKIVLIDTLTKFNHYKKDFLESHLWGFDTETKPSFKKGKVNQNKLSLIQLSSEFCTYLIRTNLVGFPDFLVDFLASPDYVKVGLSIKDDIQGLRKLRNFEPKGFIDLQSIAIEYGIEELGLRKITAVVMKRRLSKNQQLSNWEAETLSEKQLIYAATDSWVCRNIYLTLRNNEANNSKNQL